MALLTIQDMHILISQALQKHGVFAYRDIESEEIDLQLNYIMYDFVKDIVRANVNKYDGLDKNLYNLNALSTIYASRIDLGALTAFEAGQKVLITTVATDFYLPVYASAKVDYSCYDEATSLVVTKSKLSKCRIVSHEERDNLIRNSFFAPDKEELLAIIDKNYIYVYTGTDFSPATDFTVSKIYLDYIQKPVKMLYNKDVNGNYQVGGSQDCVLNDSVHYDIVERTTLRIKKLSETDPNYISLLEKSNKEVN